MNAVPLQIRATWIGCAVLMACAAFVSAAESNLGFVAGEAKPQGDGPFVKVTGGWMVPYDETIPGSDVSFLMIPVPGGTFRMGSPEDEEGRTDDEGPTFEVTVEPFWMGQHEVTWSEYKQYMAFTELFAVMKSEAIRSLDSTNETDAVTAPSNLYAPELTFQNGEDLRLPAVTMTQFAARQYTKWLSGLTGRFYRIPAESEWEYACRAGTDTPYSCGDADALNDVAWFTDNAEDTTHAVGQKRPNALGLYDMHGNVAEWIVDEFVAGGFKKPAALPQPVASESAIQWPVQLYPRVLRGGAYFDEATECRSAARRGSRDAGGDRDNPDWKDTDPNSPKSPWWYTEEVTLGVGMRLVRPFAPPATAAERRRWWEADEASIIEDVEHRLTIDGKGSLGIVDPKLPADLKKEGIWE